MVKQILYFGLCMFLCRATVAWADESKLKDKAMAKPAIEAGQSLKQLIRLALRQSTAVKDAHYDVAIARARVNQARSGYFPRFNIMAGSVIMEEGQTYSIPAGSIAFDMSSLGLPKIGNFDPNKPITNSEDLDVPITDQWINFGMITVTQPLFTGGMIRGYNRMAHGGLKVARSGRKLKRLDVVHTVVRRYNDVLFTRQLLTLGSSTHTKLKTVLKVTEGVFKAGSQKVNKLDLLKARMIVTSVGSFVEQLREANRLANLGLRFALGSDRKHPVPLRKSAGFAQAGPDQPCRQIVARALRERPESAQLRSGLKALEAGVDVAWSRYLPDIALSGGYMVDDNSIRFTDGHTFWAGVMLNYNIFEGLMTRAKVAEARAKLRQLQNKSRLLQLGITTQVRKSCLESGRARRQVALTAKALRDAEEYLQISEQSYQAELVELADLLQAQLTEAVMRAQHLKARYDLSNHLLALRKSAGDLTMYER